MVIILFQTPVSRQDFIDKQTNSVTFYIFLFFYSSGINVISFNGMDAFFHLKSMCSVYVVDNTCDWLVICGNGNVINLAE